MFGLGAGELLVILVIALVVLGPKKLPGVAKGLGRAIREFNSAKNDLMSEVRNTQTVTSQNTVEVTDQTAADSSEKNTQTKPAV